MSENMNCYICSKGKKIVNNQYYYICDSCADSFGERKQSQQDRDWLKEIVKAYDKTTVTVPTEFDSKIGELRLYLNEDQEKE